MRRCMVILCLILTAFFAVDALAAPDYGIRVTVNGKPVEFSDVKPAVKDGRTYIPLRFVSEALGAKVDWDGEKKKITITLGEKVIEMVVGQKKAFVDGCEVVLDSVPELMGDRAAVPLRFVSETLGAEVSWSDKTRTASIKQTAPPKRIREFAGVPLNPRDFVFRSGTYPRFTDEPGAEVMYATVEDLPIKMGYYIIHSLKITNNSIKVRQHSDFESPIAMYMMEDGFLCRPRNYGEWMKAKTFTYDYPIFSSGDDIWDGSRFIKNDTDITKISHFVFDTIIDKGYDQNPACLLLIKNPLYKGSGRK